MNSAVLKFIEYLNLSIDEIESARNLVKNR